jgi:hypothetical protein
MTSQDLILPTELPTKLVPTELAPTAGQLPAITLEASGQPELASNLMWP